MVIPFNIRFRSLPTLAWLAILACSSALAAFCGIRAGLATRPSHTAPAKKPANCGLVLEPARLDFGETWEAEQFHWQLPIENASEQEVRILDFSSSCTCTRIEPRSLVIAPGETREIRLTLDLTQFVARQARQDVRDFRVHVAPRFAGGGSQGWDVRGRVRVPLRFNTSSVEMGQQSEWAQPLREQTLRVTTLAPVTDLLVSVNSPNWKVTARRRAKEPFTFDLVLRQTVLLPIGDIGFLMSVQPVLADGTRLLEKKVPVRGAIVADLEVTPPQIVFGAKEVGEDAEESVTVRSLTGLPLVDLEARGEGAGITVQREGASGPPTFRVRQQVSAAGEQRGRVIVRARFPDGRQTEVAVPVIAHGVRSDRQ